MSNTMLFGVLRMPYDMAMGDDWSRWQYHQRGIEAANIIEAQAEHIRVLREALEAVMRYPEIRAYVGSQISRKADAALKGTK